MRAIGAISELFNTTHNEHSDATRLTVIVTLWAEATMAVLYRRGAPW